MRSEEQWRLVNKNLRHFVVNKRKKRGVVYLNSGNSLEHEMMKARLCYFLKENDRVFVSEAELECGGRADVLVLDEFPGVAYEVVMSESDESVERKRDRWPVRVRCFNAGSA